MNSSEINVGAILLVPLLIILVGVQSRLMAYIPFGNVTIQLLPIIAIAWALWRGDAGAVAVAFIGGLLIDLNSYTPSGVNALALIAGVMAIWPLRLLLNSNRTFIPFVLSGLGMLAYLMVHHLLLMILGYDIGLAFIVMPSTIMVHAVIIVGFYWLMRVFGRITGTRQSDLIL